MHVVTETSPNHIMPQKAQTAIAQMHASKGLLMSSVARSARSMLIEIGGRSGRLQLPWMFSRPRSDQLMCSWSSSDRGGGQPWAICHARTAAKYFLTTATEMGSKGTPFAVVGSSILGSVTAQSVNEWSSGNDAGRWLDSGMVNILQNRWNFQRPDP